MGLFNRKDKLKERMRSVNGEMHLMLQRGGDMGAATYGVYDGDLKPVYAIEVGTYRGTDRELYTIYDRDNNVVAAMAEKEQSHRTDYTGERLPQDYVLRVGDGDKLELRTSWLKSKHRVEMDYKGWYIVDRGIGYYINGVNGSDVRIEQRMVPLRYIIDILDEEDALYAVLMVLAILLTGNRYRDQHSA